MISHKKNTAYYLAFPMVSASSPETFLTGLTVSDEAYYKDGAGAWTSLSITDTVTEIGSSGMYEIDLTAAEMDYDKVLIKMTGSGAADSAFVFDMTTSSLDDIADDTGTTGVAISSATAEQIADALLNRDMSAVSDTNARTPLNALRFLRNRYAVSGTTLTVYEEDDSTAAWTATLSTDAAADPVTGSDPA